MARNKKTSTKVESIRHRDKRANIPTEELRDFVAEEEAKPKTMLYPRDPSPGSAFWGRIERYWTEAVRRKPRFRGTERH